MTRRWRAWAGCAAGVLGAGAMVAAYLLLRPLPECGFEAFELDMTVGETRRLEGPLNRAIDRAMAGSGPLAGASRKSVGHYPQFVLAYPERFSIAQGSALGLRYSRGLFGTGSELRRIRVHDALTHAVVLERAIPPGEASLSLHHCNAYFNGGCRYPSALTLATEDFRAGAYYLFLTDDTGASSSPVYFNITHPRDRRPRVVVVFPEFTWQAYNRFGNGSLYQSDVGDGVAPVQRVLHQVSGLNAVSLQRPLLFDPTGGWSWRDRAEGLKRMARAGGRWDARLKAGRARGTRVVHSPEAALVLRRALERAGIAAAGVSNLDLHADPRALEGFDVVVLAGHDEYWTQQMMDAMEAHLRGGGHLASFAGNVMWWKINLVGGTLYKDAMGGQRPGPCQDRIPKEFAGTGIPGLHFGEGGERLTGASYRFAGYSIWDRVQRRPELARELGLDPGQVAASRGFRMLRPEHPVFKGMHVARGELFGHESGIVQEEVDGVPLDAQGRIDRGFPSAIPEDTRVLAEGLTWAVTQVVAKDGHRQYTGAVRSGLIVESRPMGRTGGRAISVGSMGFVNALAQGDTTARSLLINTLGYLLDDGHG